MTTTPTTAAKRWPFVESPGDFAKRLERAIWSFSGDTLAAVRNVLIENPPTFATPAETAQPATPEPPQASAPSVQVVEPDEWAGRLFDGFSSLMESAKARCDIEGVALAKSMRDSFAGLYRTLYPALAQASALQAAIPAQQPAEPLVWIEAEPAAKGMDLRTVAKGLWLSTCWHWQAERPTPMQPDNVLFPLYAPTAQPAASQQTGEKP